MKKIITLWALFGYVLGYSQSIEKDSKYNLTIKSPDAGQLSKHIDIPASTHTGNIGVDIPIYTIKVGDYTLPIALKYHASGVKVREMASKVGLGWSLSVGGISLSKQIFGRQDKGKIGYINPDNFNPVPGNTNDYDLALLITGFNGQKYDTQPDIYSYSIGNSSGEFYFDSAGKIIQIPYNTVKIEDLFLITDNDGTKYYFKAGNQTLNTGGSVPSPGDLNITDFIISKIVLTSGKEIKFNYLNTNYSYLSNYYKGLKIPRECAVQNGIIYDEFAIKTNVLIENTLQSIEFEGSEAKFIYNSREDIAGGLSLNKIEIRTPQKALVSDYTLVKDYFVSTDTPSAPGYEADFPYLTKRLKLKEVNNSTDNSKYKLQYYESNSLPNRFSDQTDYAGFHNGKAANRGIPYVAYGDKIYGYGDDKSPDINYAVSGSLKEIKYPTGGKMEIQYELDDFYFDGTETKIGRREFLISNYEPLGAGFIVNTDANQVDFKFTFQSSANPDDNGDQLNLPEGPHFVGELLDNNNTVLQSFLINREYKIMVDKKASYKIRIRKAGNVAGSHYATLNAEWYEKLSENKQYNKSVGGIRVQKIKKIDAGSMANEVDFIYKDENNRSTGVYMGDDIDYSYIQQIAEDNETNRSCEQMVISNSGNFNIATINGKPTVYNKVITRYRNVNNAENYEVADEYLNRSHTNAKNARSPIFTYANNQFARGVLISKKYYNAQKKLVKKDTITYEFDNHFNQFSNDYSSNFPTLTIRPYFIGIKSVSCVMYDMNGVCQSRNPTFFIDRYEISSAWVKKKLMKTTNYIGNGNLNETSNYFYDSAYRHINPTSIAVDFPDSKQNTAYQYAHEKGNQLMISRNMIGIPLETSTTQTIETSTTQTIGTSTKTLSRTETIYPKTTAEITNNSASLVLPLSVVSFDLKNNLPSTEATYDRYDVKGNIQQYTTKEGISTTIIWGYNNTQPIAKIEAAKLSDISQSAIDSIINASNTDALAAPNTDETTLLNAFKTFRDNLPGYQVTTYSYDPLIGVRSITPPSGIKEVYVYDTANRLEKVIDVNGKVLKEYKYNYKN